MSIELKIKSKHLALEPSIIRKEEQKLKKQIKYTKGTDSELIEKLNSLVLHRKHNVRTEARATQLALAYIRGKPYNSIELTRKFEKEWQFQNIILPRILTMVQKYYNKKTNIEDIKEWVNKA